MHPSLLPFVLFFLVLGARVDGRLATRTEECRETVRCIGHSP